jgi:hypothetical protein
MAVADSAEATSVSTKIARPPSASIEAATFSPASTPMSATTTAAPSAARARA